jgi:hypothetical protein
VWSALGDRQRLSLLALRELTQLREFLFQQVAFFFQLA